MGAVYLHPVEHLWGRPTILFYAQGTLSTISSQLTTGIVLSAGLGEQLRVILHSESRGSILQKPRAKIQKISCDPGVTSFTLERGYGSIRGARPPAARRQENTKRPVKNTATIPRSVPVDAQFAVHKQMLDLVMLHPPKVAVQIRSLIGPTRLTLVNNRVYEGTTAVTGAGARYTPGGDRTTPSCPVPSFPESVLHPKI